MTTTADRRSDPPPAAGYHHEEFTAEETAILERFFTNTTEPIFALINLPEVVKGAMFARYSRSPKSLRRLFLDEFYDAAAADLVLSRAGASSLGEYPLFGLPAILVPYPHAWRYQKVNADYLARRGAAVILEDHVLGNDLMTTLNVLFENPNKLKAMRAAMFELSHPRAAEKIASKSPRFIAGRCRFSRILWKEAMPTCGRLGTWRTW